MTWIDFDIYLKYFPQLQQMFHGKPVHQLCMQKEKTLHMRMPAAAAAAAAAAVAYTWALCWQRVLEVAGSSRGGLSCCLDIWLLRQNWLIWDGPPWVQRAAEDRLHQDIPTAPASPTHRARPPSGRSINRPSVRDSDGLGGGRARQETRHRFRSWLGAFFHAWCDQACYVICFCFFLLLFLMCTWNSSKVS